MKKILLLLLLPVFSLSYGQGRARLDSLLNLLNHEYSNRQDAGKARLLLQVAIEYRLQNNDSGNAYVNTALPLARRIGDKFGEAMCLYQIGSGTLEHNGMGDLMRALTLFEQIDDKAHVAMVLNVIAGHYYNMEWYPQALVYFERTLMAYEKIQDQYNTARTKANIGETHGRLGNFTKALEYQLAALPYFEKTGSHNAMTAMTLSNIGNSYLGLREYNKAIAYASRGIRLSNSVKMKSYQIAFALSDMGHIYFTAANDSTVNIHPDSLLYAGRKENLANAIYYYTAAHQIYEKDPHFIPTNIALRLSNALAATGQFKEAWKYAREHAAFQELMLSEGTRLKVSAAETRREADLKDKEITTKKEKDGCSASAWGLWSLWLCWVGAAMVRKSGQTPRLPKKN